MRIIIEYESSWRNSFLDGSNNEKLPKKGRNFIGSMTALKQSENFKSCSITKDTVMGILNRLIGDQRKLYQAREDPNYYFADIERYFTEENIFDHAQLDYEVVFIRNISGSEDQNSFTGMIKGNSLAFTSDFSNHLWGILFLEISSVVDFILDPTMTVSEPSIHLEPLVVIEKLEKLNTLKAIDVEGNVETALIYLKNKFSDVDFKLTAKGQIAPISLFTSALYLQIERLKSKYDLSNILTKSGGLSGISKRGFTKKDFMAQYTTGAKKKIWGNPYVLKERIKGEGEVTSMLKKARGTLEINLAISQVQARDLEEKIENAGVSSFYLGKKGLAYITDIKY